MKAHLGKLFAFLLRHRVKVVLVTLALGMLGLGAYQARCYYSAESHLRAANQAAARYDFDAAQEHLAACLRLRPESASLHLAMARAARGGGNYDRAADHLMRCQQLEGMTHANALEWAMLKAQWGEIVKVEQVLQEEVDRGSPETPQILEALAQGYIHTYRLDGAMYCLDRLLAHNSDNVQALLWRGSLWQTAGNNLQAEADYRRAIAAQPNHVKARCQLGEFFLLHNQAAEALRQYEYLRQRPGGDQPSVLLGLARSQRELGGKDAALQVLDELLTRHPHDGHALIERGKLALENESPAAAENWFRRAIADYPFDAQANYLLAQSLRGQGKDDAAREYEAAQNRIESDLKRLESAFKRVTAAPSDPEPRLEAGLICLRNGKEREGERWLLSVLEQVPNHGLTRAALADHYERVGKADLAAQYRLPAPGIGSGKPPGSSLRSDSLPRN